ncbi:Protein of unknown function [Gryllus bimaculatus]|nr:Protein of unknown function [Gryllus bimaculatus]
MTRWDAARRGKSRWDEARREAQHVPPRATPPTRQLCPAGGGTCDVNYYNHAVSETGNLLKLHTQNSFPEPWCQKCGPRKSSWEKRLEVRRHKKLEMLQPRLVH